MEFGITGDPGASVMPPVDPAQGFELATAPDRFSEASPARDRHRIKSSAMTTPVLVGDKCTVAI